MHEELKAQYAEDAAVHPRHWELWHTIKNGLIGWRQCNSVDMDFSNSAYRRHKHADLMIEAHPHQEFLDAVKDGKAMFGVCEAHPHQEFFGRRERRQGDVWGVRMSTVIVSAPQGAGKTRMFQHMDNVVDDWAPGMPITKGHIHLSTASVDDILDALPMNWFHHDGDIVLVPHPRGLDLAFIEVYTE